ncbi:Pentatricopeptide repeat-containing protein [Heracleum sosnowskyi]|uniref:Pentatricopeptide repeat-containing protein n=1 Tax=Heracleum sosnowskyi TaxID=360622 RepID=A0AAD8H7V8_9APIA|nr:Pentatricopeptide repeat-containing protein [Heracleum sosnowskyi]
MKREITKLVADGLYTQALSLYSHYHARSFNPGKFTFPALLKACAKLNLPSHGQILHAHLLKTGFHAHIHTATALVDMYAKLHFLDNALKVFDGITEPNIAVFNVVISGFSLNGCYKEAFRVFGEIGVRKLRADSVSIASLLSVCRDVKEGCQVHCWGVKIGVEVDVYVGTSLVTMYSKCRELVFASKVFEQIGYKSLVCYNALVSGLVLNGVPLLVLDVFREIRRSVQVHGFLVKIGMNFDTMVGTALLDMYCKCRCLHAADDLFKELKGRRSLITWNSMIGGMMLNGETENAIELFMQIESEGLKPDSATWNSMISGFSQLGKEMEAFLLFKKMQSVNVAPTLKSITSLLSVCSSMLALRCGKEIHGHGIRLDISDDEFFATTLVDMYMKSGESSHAKRIFDKFELKPRDPAIWNAMISGHGRNGEHEDAFQIFGQMLEENVKPNSATFNCILSVCSHCGEVDKGREIFRLMDLVYGLKPTTENLSCMVDLLGRSGHLDEAWKLLQDIPEPSNSMFSSLLGASKYHLEPKLGKDMAERLLVSEPDNPTPYVILSNIYAGLGRWQDAKRVRQMIDRKKLKKLPAYSLIGLT